MSTYYLDSSVAVHVVVGTLTATAWFDAATAEPGTQVISSRLLRTELTRVLRRLGEQVGRRDSILDHVGTIPLDHAVLLEAEAIAPHVKTLDSIHLASALRSGIEDIVVCTHDENMKSVALLMGMAVQDPVAGQVH